MLVDDAAIGCKHLVERDAVVREPQEPRQPALAVLDLVSADDRLPVDDAPMTEAWPCSSSSAATPPTLHFRAAAIRLCNGFSILKRLVLGWDGPKRMRIKGQLVRGYSRRMENARRFVSRSPILLASRPRLPPNSCVLAIRSS